MRRLSELEDRVAYLEKQVLELKKDRLRDQEWMDERDKRMDERYKNINKLIEHYVQSHIWFTQCHNPELLEKGEKIRVILQNTKDILED